VFGKISTIHVISLWETWKMHVYQVAVESQMPRVRMNQLVGPNIRIVPFFKVCISNQHSFEPMGSRY